MMSLLPFLNCVKRTDPPPSEPVPSQNLADSRETPPDIAISCSRMLHGLTRSDLAALVNFAHFRLAKVGLNSLAGEDVVQEAMLAVLRGSESPSEGRHPRLIDVNDSHRFTDYLKGVIGSLVEAERRRGHQHWVQLFDHASAADGLPEMPDGIRGSLQSEVELSDLRQELFRAVNERAPNRLKHVVRAWAEQGEQCDYIPLLGRHRRYRSELRRLAAQVLKELINPIALQRKGTTK
jgi:hypothetical protein